MRLLNKIQSKISNQLLFISCLSPNAPPTCNQACHFETNQVHVGGALGERHQINKGSLEIFACILLSNRMIRLCGKFYPCSFIPNCT